MSDSSAPATPASPLQSFQGNLQEVLLVPSNGALPEGCSLLDVYNSDPLSFEMIFESNGWTKEDFLTQREKLTYMEMFLLNIPKFPHIQYFPKLVNVKLIHIGLTEIGSSFENLRCLETLWLSENKLKVIDGLENCTMLRELYLNINQISRVENLHWLTNLEVLWLNNNQISKMEGLDKLTKLRSVWFAGNRLTSLDNFFYNLNELDTLNVSGNQIASFREIPALAVLPNLTRLYLSDPTYGENPLCSLCNYQIFTLYHLSRLTCLDYMSVGADQRSLAVATFTKKTMYYQMRIKTLRRNHGHLLAAAADICQRKQDELQLPITALQKTSQELRRELAEEEEFLPLLGINEEATARLKQIKSKLAGIESLLAERLRESLMISKQLALVDGDMSHAYNAHIMRLLLELNTGGNVRIEEGKQKDVWYRSCVELLRTRFFPSEFEPLGLKDLKVTRVSRLYNRALRGRFDAALEELVDLSDPSYQRALEYLFFVDVNGTFVETSQLNDVIENGFSERDFRSGIPLTNSLFLAEQARLAQCFKKGELSGRNQTSRTLQTQILVAKVFLGKCASERVSGGTSGGASVSTVPPTLSKEGSTVGLAEKNLSPVVAGSPPIDRSAYAPTTLSVYRPKSNDSRQRVWFCLDPTLVLPEYIIDVSYVAGPLLQPSAPGEWTGDGKVQELHAAMKALFPHNVSRVDLADFTLAAPYFMSYSKVCEQLAAQASATKAADVIAADPALDQRPPLESLSNAGDWHKNVLGSAVADRLASAPSSQFHFTRADFCNRQIKSLQLIFANAEVAPVFGNLRSLVVSFNELAKIDVNLASYCPQLEHIDFSHNHLKRIDGAFSDLAQMKTLNLGHNLFYRLEDVIGLEELPKLTELTLVGNPFCTSKRFTQFVASHLAALRIFNGSPVDLAERGPTVVTAPLLIHAARKSQNWMMENMTTFSFSSLPISARTAQEEPTLNLSETEEGLLARTEALSLKGLVLSKMQHSAWLRSLIKLDLSDNFLTKLDGLGALTNLTELSLENNLLRSLESLGTMPQLRKLEVGRNRIGYLTGVERYPQLVFLSLEENEVESIAVLSKLPFLMEAYFAKNRIKNGKEVNLLRELGKLIIMDLTGNPCTSEESYRLYSIFQLKKLKVLDGVSVDPAEAATARDTFAGRVNTELLNERVGEGMTWDEARELSLASCALKEITMLDAFANLMHLKLDHNNLTDVSGLKRCASLVSINLAHNKLGASPVGRTLELLSNLESISLEANGIQSLSSLQLRLSSLKFLNVKANELLKVDGLDNLPELRELMLDKNRLRSLERDCFAANYKLRELYAEENCIKTLEGVRALSNLLKLSLAVNRISEVADIDRGVGGNTQIVEVCFLGNAVVRKSMYRPHVIHMLPACLVIDNKEISLDERERAEQLFQQDTAIPPNVFTDVRSPVTGGGSIAVTQMPSPPYQQQKAISVGGGIRLVTIDGAQEPLTPPALTGGGGTGSGGIGRRGPSVGGAPRSTATRTQSADLGGFRPRAKASPTTIPTVKRR